LVKRKVVFATPDKNFALAMIWGTRDELAVGYYKNTKTKEKIMYIDELKPKKLELLNQEGYLYEVDNGGFTQNKRLMKEEYIVTKDIKVQKEIKIKNILTRLKRTKKVKIVPYDNVLKEMQKRDKETQ